MGRSSHGDGRWEEDKEEAEVEEEEEEEEALSFCDLPVKEEQQPLIRNENPIKSSVSAAVQTVEDFDFNHWPPPPPMCAADDVFFQGHMLPLRLSFTSDNTHNHFFSKNLSFRSESMDHNMFRFRNGSSSSSSSRSQYSRSSSTSNNSISIPTNSKPRTQKNIFHSHPSPTPQIRSISTSGRRSRSSSRWGFFRLGLLRTPGMELHDLKTRSTTAAAAPTAEQKTTASSFLGVVSCKKSVDTILAAPEKNRSNWSRSIVNKRSEKGKGNGIGDKVIGELMMMKRLQKQQKVLNDNNVEISEKNQKEKETRLSHHRTFEWLKQLSHATFADEQ